MQNISVILLRVAIALIGVGVLAFLLIEPHFEGRNADATLFEVYFKDPFLLGVYAASSLFFMALYTAFRLVGNIGKPQLYSESSLGALRTIKRCLTALVVLIAGALGYLFIAVRGEDDIAGGVAIGLFIMVSFGTAAAIAALFERRLGKEPVIKV